MLFLAYEVLVLFFDGHFLVNRNQHFLQMPTHHHLMIKIFLIDFNSNIFDCSFPTDYRFRSHTSFVDAVSTLCYSILLHRTISPVTYPSFPWQKSISKEELQDKELQDLQAKYKHLKVLVIDEVSMIGRLSCDDLSKFLKQIKNNDRHIPFHHWIDSGYIQKYPWLMSLLSIFFSSPPCPALGTSCLYSHFLYQFSII